MVVLDHEDQGQAMDSGPVHRLVPVALRCRALTPYTATTASSPRWATAWAMPTAGVLGPDDRGLGQDAPPRLDQWPGS